MRKMPPDGSSRLGICRPGRASFITLLMNGLMPISFSALNELLLLPIERRSQLDAYQTAVDVDGLCGHESSVFACQK